MRFNEHPVGTSSNGCLANGGNEFRTAAGDARRLIGLLQAVGDVAMTGAMRAITGKPRMSTTMSW